jgi:PAS domain S-box-containing protein
MSTLSNGAPTPILRRSPGEEQFRVFIESVRDYALLILDTGGHVTTWNRGAEAIKGWKASEIIGQHFSVFYPPESIANGLPQRELVGAEKDERYEDEGWRMRKDGTRFWANVIITALRDSDGTLIGFAKVTRDLSERRRHEETLRHNESRFRSLVEGVRDYAIFMLDTAGCVTSWNAGAAQIMGYDAVSVLGEHISLFYPRDGRQQELAATEIRTATEEGRFEDEGWRMRKDGSRFWASVVLTAIRDVNGNLVGFSKITRDLTERRVHENSLRESEARFRVLVDSVVDYAIITVDEEGFINSWNLGAERITGFGAAEIVGKHFSRLYSPDDVATNKPWRQLIRASQGTRVNEETWRLRKDGSQYWANSVLGRLPHAEGGSPRYYLVIQDLTQRRHAESLADTAQRMHEFIAMLAHELRNPLAPIRNAVALMQRRNIQDPIVESMRQTIERQSGQLTRIIDELLDVNRVARGQFTIDKHAVDLREIVQRAVETSRPLIEAREHTLTLDIDSNPVVVAADPMRMQQVLANLLNNAAKYTQQKGEIHLSLHTADGKALLKVRDNGKGIERESLDRVFDLFIQLDPNPTNSLGGLGVGLALVRRIVELHGGRVQAYSEGAQRGSEFQVHLPLGSQSTADDAEEPRKSVEAPVGLRVLVVDDNADAADSLGFMLKEMKLDVRMVYDGPTALRTCESFKPHLVMLDIGMPKMSGYEVARAIRMSKSCGNPTIVAVTGWGQESDKARARESGFDRHFTKPVGDSELQSLLADVAAQVTSQ